MAHLSTVARAARRGAQAALKTKPALFQTTRAASTGAARSGLFAAARAPAAGLGPLAPHLAGACRRTFATDPSLPEDKDEAPPPKINKIAFIGAGKMAEAMISGMLTKGIQTPETMCVHDVWESACKRVTDRYPGVKRAKKLTGLTKDADVIVLAVKPQEAQRMLADLYEAINSPEGKPSEKLCLVSIMTGKSVTWLYEQSGVPRIVRAMPNTPVSIQEGCVVWVPTNEVGEHELKALSGMFAAIGDHVMVSDERYLDMSTAISGSGPYYLFLTMETMVDAGVHMGLPRPMSERLVKQTLLGSCMYAINSKKSITALRNDIISPGGTTASAQYTLERGGFRATVYDAIWAAYRRSLELGGEDSNVGPGRSSTAVLRTMEFSEEHSEKDDDDDHHNNPLGHIHRSR